MCDLAFFKVSVSVKYAERTPESEILSVSQKKFHTISWSGREAIKPSASNHGKRIRVVQTH